MKRDAKTWKDWRLGLIGLSFLLACVTWQVNMDANAQTTAPAHAANGERGGP